MPDAVLSTLHHHIIGFSQHPYKKGANYLLCTDEETELIHLPKVTVCSGKKWDFNKADLSPDSEDLGHLSDIRAK